MKKLTRVSHIKNPYSKRILSNVIGQDSLKIYSTTPRKLRKMLVGLSERHLRTRPAKGRWSISYLVSHLCDAEWATGFRIRMAIAQPGRPFQAYDQDLWAENLHYDKAGCKQKLELFAALRTSHLVLLKTLKPREWQRYGIHEERGKESVERMVHLLAGHDINHLMQIREIRAQLLRMA
ncbi:MAG: DinB family protein [Ignavibacteriae bacterium]|nr:DinB family protein [Ignavibacteria bacterium]MBI3363646.1 DinB family protein [Ignavibacteriota bacterium]